MKNVMFAMAAAVALAAGATPAFADTVGAEVRVADVRGGHPGSTEFDIKYDAPLVSIITYGAEIDVNQGRNAGSIGANVNGRLGVSVPQFAGFKSQVYGEAGQSLNQNNNFVFWGAGIDANHKLVGPVSITGGFRHREDFSARYRFVENQAKAGLALGLTHGNTVNVTYYRNDGTRRSDAVGVGFVHAF